MPSYTKISVIALAVVALAGCGGSHSNSGVKGVVTTASQPSTTFGTAKVSGVGTVLVDGKGRTVYILTSAAKKNVPCTDASGCTGVWPDLPLPKGTAAATAGKGLNASLLGAMKLSDGETYPTYNGYLMYEYTGDSGPGHANGQGVKSFGGTWYALSPSGQPVKSSSSSGGGYGGGGY